MRWFWQHTPVIQEKERLPVAEISGRVLAEDAKDQSLTIRPFPARPIDGYACRAADLDWQPAKERPVCLTGPAGDRRGGLF